MNTNKTDHSIEDVQMNEDYQAALKLSEEPQIFKALIRALNDEKQKEFAIQNPKDFLNQEGVIIPNNLSVKFSKSPRDLKPIPGVGKSVRLFNCRTFFVRDEDGLLREKTVCFGFEISSFPFSPVK